MNGFLNVLKPTGMTSHDVVKVLRRILEEKKTGHTGTLDPMAVGVLPVGIGTATKMTEYLDGDRKRYRCEMALGLTTNTGDIWGEEVRRQPVPEISEEEVRAFEQVYRGEMEQTPPMYSAVRVNGRRLYEYARSGEEIEVKSRKITIWDLTIRRFTGERILFDVECSKGTYIRTICTEIGERLGCGGAMSFLARTGSGTFSIEQAVTFEEIQEHLEKGLPKEELLLPVDYPIQGFPKAELNLPKARVFINGGHIRLRDVELERAEGAVYYRVYCGDTFLAMATVDDARKKLIPHKVFYRDYNGGTNL